MSKKPQTEELNKELSSKSLTELIQLEGLRELTKNITRLTINAIPEKYREETREWDIIVESRGDNNYAVIWKNKTYSKQGEWEYESLPSSRTKKYIKNSRYPLAKAVKIAEELSRTVKFFQYTAVDYTFAQESRDNYNQLNPDRKVELMHELGWMAESKNEGIQRELAYYAYVDTLPDVPNAVKNNMNSRREKYLQQTAENVTAE